MEASVNDDRGPRDERHEDSRRTVAAPRCDRRGRARGSWRRRRGSCRIEVRWIARGADPVDRGRRRRPAGREHGRADGGDQAGDGRPDRGAGHRGHAHEGPGDGNRGTPRQPRRAALRPGRRTRRQGRPGHGHGGPGGGPSPSTRPRRTSASRPRTLRTQLAAGKTLAAIATANGKTVDGLKAALTTAAKSDLDAAVTAGKLTQAQEDKILAACRRASTKRSTGPTRAAPRRRPGRPAARGLEHDPRSRLRPCMHRGQARESFVPDPDSCTWSRAHSGCASDLACADRGRRRRCPAHARALARGGGLCVALAADGGGALVEIERSAPDVILLDVAMPGIDGLAVARRVRGKGDAVPILLLTARDAVADRVAGLDAGADDYLVKPFATDELLARVRALLRRGRPAGDLLSVGDVTLDLRRRAGLARGSRSRAHAARGRPARAAAAQRARRRLARSGARPGLGRRRRDRQRRRPLRGLSAAQARRPAAHPDRAGRRLRPRAMRAPASLRVRVALAAGAAIALATVLLGITAVALSEREQASSRDAALRAGATSGRPAERIGAGLLTAPGALEGRRRRPRLLVEVVDRHGRIVARSASLGGGVLGTRAEIADVIASGPAPLFRREASAASRCALYRAPLATVGAGPAAGGAVLVATAPRRTSATATACGLSSCVAAAGGGRCSRSGSPCSSRAAPCARSPTSPPRPARSATRATRPAGCPRRTRATRSARSRRRSMRCSPRSSGRASPSAASSPTPRTSCARPLTALRGNAAYIAQHGADAEVLADIESRRRAARPAARRPARARTRGRRRPGPRRARAARSARTCALRAHVSARGTCSGHRPRRPRRARSGTRQPGRERTPARARGRRREDCRARDGRASHRHGQRRRAGSQRRRRRARVRALLARQPARPARRAPAWASPSCARRPNATAGAHVSRDRRSRSTCPGGHAPERSRLSESSHEPELDIGARTQRSCPVNFLRTTSTRRLIAGAALTVAVVVGGVAVATASSSGGTPPPAEGARRRDPRRARGAQARGSDGAHPLHQQPDLDRCRQHRLAAALAARRPAVGRREGASASSCSRTPETRRSPSRTGACRSTTRPATPSTAPTSAPRAHRHHDGDTITRRRASRRSPRPFSSSPSRPRSRAPSRRLRPARAPTRSPSRPSTTPGCSARPSSPGTRPTASRCASPSPPPAAARPCSRSR